MSRRLTMCGLFLAALVPWFAPVRPAAAQAPDDNTKEVTFKTFDEVTLKGTLYKSKKGGNSPVVMLLHAFGEDPNKGDFRGLAKKLSEDHGFHVFRFDFRGHGQSKLVSASKFWDDPINKAYLPRALVKKAADKLDVNDFKTYKNGAYYPRLADDILAARIALDQLNDNSEVNTSSVYLIGAKDAVTNGFLYMSAEWARPQKLPPIMVQRFPPLPPARQSVLGPGDPAAGQDVAGCVWLSPTRHPSVPSNVVQQWVQYAPDMRERTPMLFLYGEKDGISRAGASFFRDEVLAARVAGGTVPKLPLTRALPIEKTDLSGANLLGKQLATEKLITDYLDALEKERKNLIRLPNRGYVSSPGINLPLFGVCKF